MSKLQEEIETFTINFSGSSYIDSEDLSVILSNLAKIIKVTAQEIDPNAYCKLNFKQSRNGSIEIDFATVSQVTSTLFNIVSQGVGVAWIATQTLEKILDIKQKLKNKKFEIIKDDKKECVVKTEDNQEFKIDKTQSRADLYFKDVVFDDCVVNIFTSATKEEERKFSLKRKDAKPIEYNESDVSSFKRKVINKEDLEKSMIDKKEEIRDLIIKKPDFLGSSKWEVVSDRKINVSIEDEEFSKKVKSGLVKIYAGCKIKAKMNIITKTDTEFNIIGEPDYKVIEVIGDIIEPHRDDLFHNTNEN